MNRRGKRLPASSEQTLKYKQKPKLKMWNMTKKPYIQSKKYNIIDKKGKRDNLKAKERAFLKAEE